MSQGIFISYRRSDSSGYAHALAARLVQQFETTSVFMDVDSLEPGVDFVETIGNSLSSCKILLALIGNNWTGTQEGSHPRITGDSDYVRAEVAEALARGIRVIPILIDNATMPQVKELPDNLKPLTRRQAIEWSNTRFNSDLDWIVESTKKAIGWEEPGKMKISTHKKNTIEPTTETPTDQPDAPEINSGQDVKEKRNKPAQTTSNHRVPIRNQKKPTPVATTRPSFIKVLLRFGFAILPGFGIYYVTWVLAQNIEIAITMGLVCFVFTLTIMVLRHTLPRSLTKLLLVITIIASGSYIALNWHWNSVLNNAGEQLQNLRGTHSPLSRSVPTSPNKVIPSKEKGNLWNFHVTQEGRNSTGDFIRFTVEFNYLGLASKICVGGGQAFNGTNSTYFAYRSYCQPVVSGQASGTAQVNLSIHLPWNVFNYTSNQIHVYLFDNNGITVHEQHFPFQKTWKK